MKGIKKEALSQPIIINDTNTTLAEYIMAHEGVDTIEQTSTTHKNGK